MKNYVKLEVLTEPYGQDDPYSTFLIRGYEYSVLELLSQDCLEADKETPYWKLVKFPNPFLLDNYRDRERI